MDSPDDILKALQKADAAATAGDASAANDARLLARMYNQAAQQPAKPNTAVDVVRSIPGGLAKGVAAIAGLPGDIHSGMDQASAYALQKMGLATPDSIKRGREWEAQHTLIPQAPTSSDIEGAVSQPFGGFYEPQTQAGKYTETLASFAPSALSPGSAVRRVARVVIPGAASEAAGQLTEGTPLAPYGRTLGALVGGGVSGLGEGLANEHAQSARTPSTAQVKASADYASFAQKPINLTREAVNALGDKIGQTAIRRAMNEAQINQEPHLVAEFQGLLNPGQAFHPNVVSTEAADKIRQAFDSLANDAGTPNAARGWSNRSDAMETAIQQAPEINDARNSWAQFRKSQILDKAMQRATDKAGTPAGFGDPAQAMRREFLNLQGSAKFSAFSSAEQAAIKAVGNGTLTTNTLQQLGKFSPVRGQITRWLELGGAASGFAPAALGAAVGGEVARQGSNFATARGARLASELVRSGGTTVRQLGSSIVRGAATGLAIGQRPEEAGGYVRIRDLSRAVQAQ